MDLVVEYRWSVASGITDPALYGEIHETHVVDQNDSMMLLATIMMGIAQGFDVNTYYVEDT